MRAGFATWVTLMTGLAAGCSCSRHEGEVDGVTFTRCAQMDPPASGSVELAGLKASVEERRLTLAPAAPLRIAAFSGPVAGVLSTAELSALRESKPTVIVWLGGLGASEDEASQNLAAVATLEALTIFVAGGADRETVVRAAFASLDDGPRARTLNATGLRHVAVGQDHFALVSGSPMGRYAVDEQACGFVEEDLEEVRDALDADLPGGARVWLLSWAAPAGWGISSGLGGHDVGSAELADLAKGLGARGGLFAYPETQTGMVVLSEERGGQAVVVPRLGPTGAARALGGFVPSSFALLVLGADGLVSSP